MELSSPSNIAEVVLCSLVAPFVNAADVDALVTLLISVSSSCGMGFSVGLSFASFFLLLRSFLEGGFFSFSKTLL